MTNRIDKKELVRRVEAHIKNDVSVEAIVDAALEEIYEALKRGEIVSLRNFGTFYIDERRHSTVFKFNPSQRMRAMLGWSSTYKGEI